ncbi:unnamed protein product [Camellia sinensis]
MPTLFQTEERERESMEIEVASRAECGGDDMEKGVVGLSGGDERGMYLVWEDLRVVVPNFGNGHTKRLINGLTGFAEPGRIMAIMGPSGSGKSTLLHSLAAKRGTDIGSSNTGRLSGNVIMTGNVLINGKKRSLHYGVAAYLTQEDTLLGSLTVRETITYSAHLRLPTKNMSKEKINGIIEGTLTEMGLQDCADHLIGNWHLRGISGGEKKRLSIALEILTRPHLLFLDEPTSGLDSASAFFVTQILRNIAHDGRTVISSIHQPSSEVFALFDDLFLISGGETVYFGEAKMAVETVLCVGYPCPSRRSPSDHFLRCINSNFDNVTASLIESHRIPETEKSSSLMMNLAIAEIRSMLVKKYKCSKHAARARARVQEISTIEGLVMETKTGSQATWCKQLSTLTKRSFINMSRDVGYYWLRIITYIVVSISVGSIFFNVGTSYSAILARASCGGFISGFMIFMSIGGFPSFIEEMKFRPGFSHFACTCLDLVSSIAVVESCMMVVASLVPNFLMGLITGAGIIGVMMMTAGFFRFLPDLPKPFWCYPMSYINYMAWALQGEYKNDMIGLEFDPLQPGDPKLKGEVIINTVLGISLDHSKWWDLTVVIVILIVYRLLFFTILKFKERASPVFRTIYTKRTLHHLSKRPSFRKTPPFPSQRHQVMHSLSSQEGLNSPIH